MSFGDDCGFLVICGYYMWTIDVLCFSLMRVLAIFVLSTAVNLLVIFC
jgi:hypothetical protein